MFGFKRRGKVPARDGVFTKLHDQSDGMIFDLSSVHDDDSFQFLITARLDVKPGEINTANHAELTHITATRLRFALQAIADRLDDIEIAVFEKEQENSGNGVKE